MIRIPYDDIQYYSMRCWNIKYFRPDRYVCYFICINISLCVNIFCKDRGLLEGGGGVYVVVYVNLLLFFFSSFSPAKCVIFLIDIISSYLFFIPLIYSMLPWFNIFTLLFDFSTNPEFSRWEYWLFLFREIFLWIIKTYISCEDNHKTIFMTLFIEHVSNLLNVF